METQAPPREGRHQIVVRMPVSLHEQLVALATANGVSVNQQVCDLVERHAKAGP